MGLSCRSKNRGLPVLFGQRMTKQLDIDEIMIAYQKLKVVFDIDFEMNEDTQKQAPGYEPRLRINWLGCLIRMLPFCVSTFNHLNGTLTIILLTWELL
jgi:hypothetical protein